MKRTRTGERLPDLSIVARRRPNDQERTLGIIGISGTCLMPVYGVLFYRKACRLHL